MILSPVFGLAVGLFVRSFDLFFPAITWMHVAGGFLAAGGTFMITSQWLLVVHHYVGHKRHWTIAQTFRPAILGGVLAALTMGSIEYLLAAVKLAARM
jgi:hypothetical protein